MRVLIFLFFLSLFGALTDSAVAGDASWCRPSQAPVINVHASTDEILYNFGLSEKELENFGTTTVSPYAANIITDVGGLMKGGIETQQRMSFGTLTNTGTNQVCYWHDKVDVYIHIKPTIYIAREFPKGSCMHEAIMAHELKHVVVDRDIVNKYARLIGDALRADVNRYRVFGPLPVSQKNALQSQLKTRMQSILTTYTTKMATERRQRQQQVDSLSEYERVNHLCPGERRR